MKHSEKQTEFVRKFYGTNEKFLGYLESFLIEYLRNFWKPLQEILKKIQFSFLKFTKWKK